MNNQVFAHWFSLYLVFILFAGHFSYSFFSPGETGYNFLKLGIGARPVAMGNAFTAVGDDANSLFWNPGGMGISQSCDGTLMIMNLLSSVTYGAVGIKSSIGRHFATGIGGALLSAKDTRRDELGNEIGEYYFNNYLLSFGFAVSPGQSLSFGGALKGVGSRIDTFSSYSLAMDAGVILSPNRHLFLGSCLRDLGTPQEFIQERDPMPTSLRLGAAYKIPILIHQLLVSSDLIFYLDYQPIFAGGGEFILKDVPKKDEYFAIRAGYSSGYHFRSEQRLSFGIGYGKKVAYRTYLVIDATYFDYGYLGSQERISVSLKWGAE